MPLKVKAQVTSGDDENEVPQARVKESPCTNCGQNAYRCSYVSQRLGDFGEAAFEQKNQVKVYFLGAFLVDAIVRNNKAEQQEALNEAARIVQMLSGRKVAVNTEYGIVQDEPARVKPVRSKPTGPKLTTEELFEQASKALGISVAELKSKHDHPTNKGLVAMRLRNLMNRS